jgi:hypothetical protein
MNNCYPSIRSVLLPIHPLDIREAKTGEGLSPRIQTSPWIETPHPALRATFSHKGRREEQPIVGLPHPLRHLAIP